MPLPAYGALPLSKTFALVRILQVISMIVIVGISANFVSEIVAAGIPAPKEVVGTLTITCIATLYSIVSIAFYWSEAQLGLFVMTGIDSLLLIAFIVVSVSLGKPLSFLRCEMVTDSLAPGSGYAFIMSIAKNLNLSGSALNITKWVGATKANCYEAKAIWGLSIALCILFTTSCALLPTLWYKSKKAAAPAKGEV